MSELFELSCEPITASVQPGGASVSFIVTVRNAGEIVDQCDLRALGIPEDWYELEPTLLSLFPDDVGKSTLLIRPPARQDVLAGDYPVTLQAVSRDDPSQVASLALTLTVAPVGTFRLTLVKSEVVGRAGSFRARVANLSNDTLDILVRSSDPAGGLEFTPPDEQLIVEAGYERDAETLVRPKNRPWVSDRARYRAVIEAVPNLANPQEAAQATQRAEAAFVYAAPWKQWPWEVLPGWARLALTTAIPLLSALVLLFACAPREIQPWNNEASGGGGDEGGGGQVSPPSIEEFLLEPQSGGDYQLKWRVTGDDLQVITVDGTEADAEGEKSVLAGDHVLVAKNPGGEVRQRLAAFPLVPPRIERFTADPPEVPVRSETTLSWRIIGEPDRIEINGVILCDNREACGQQLDVAGHSVTVQTETNFLLTAENGAGYAGRRFLVRVQ